jgi:TRAP-type C4-dicarboxylate transport system permease small subunit
MIGAWLLNRAIGTIWPLIGHALYDAAQFTALRTGHAWAYTALPITAAIGALLLVQTIALARRFKDCPTATPDRRHQRPADPAPADRSCL